MIEIIATAAVSFASGGLVAANFFRKEMRSGTEAMSWANGEIERLEEQAKNDKVWLDERAATIADLEAKLRDADQRATKAEVALAAEKAKDSARTAKGNRTRRLNRLAREVPQGAGGSNVASTFR